MVRLSRSVHDYHFVLLAGALGACGGASVAGTEVSQKDGLRIKDLSQLQPPKDTSNLTPELKFFWGID
jgi:hypothetical protein